MQDQFTAIALQLVPRFANVVDLIVSSQTRWISGRSSRTSRSSALIRSRSSVVTPSRMPLSFSACLTHPLKVWGNTADLGCNGRDRARLRFVAALMLEHHSDRASADLRRVAICHFAFCHNHHPYLS